MKEELEKTVKAMAQKAINSSTAHNSSNAHDAMQYTQAALNAANALATLENITRANK